MFSHSFFILPEYGQCRADIVQATSNSSRNSADQEDRKNEIIKKTPPYRLKLRDKINGDENAVNFIQVTVGRENSESKICET